MTSSKNTKRALLASVLSVLLCVAMLLGSTWAWFTDTVTSGNNKIVAGNLDVELYHGDDLTDKVDGSTNLFTNADGTAIQWEPGVIAYENFKVVNEGSLALKYQLTMNIAGYNTVKDTELSLVDVLKVAILEEPFSGDRTAAQALTFDSTLSDFLKEDVLLSGESDTYAVVIYWEPGANDNDYNLNNGKESSDGEPLYVDLGVTLVATQTPYEEDSFGNDYDENAFYADVYAGTAAELLTAVQNANSGDIIGLETDISLTDRLVVEGKSITLDLNGRTITFGGDYTTAGANDDVTPIRVNAGGSLTITGNGTIDATGASEWVVPVSVMAGSATVDNPATLVIENGTIKADTKRESCVYVYGEYGSAVIYGGTFINNSTEPYAYGGGDPLTLNVYNNYPSGGQPGPIGTITVYGGTFVGRNPAEGDDNRQDLAPTFVADGYQSTEVSEGKYVVTEEGTTPVAAAGLQAALSNAEPGETVLLTEDVMTDGIISLGDKNVTLDLNDNALDVTAVNIHMYEDVQENEANIVIKNGTITGSGDPYYGCDGPLSIYCDPSENLNVTVENVTVVANEDVACAIYSYGADVTLNNLDVTGLVYFTDGFGTINGGTYTARPTDPYLIDSNYGAEINGGTFTVTEEDQVIFKVSEPSAETSFTINDGTFAYHSASAPIGYDSDNIRNPRTYITIEGGTFNGVPYQADKYDDLLKDTY